MGGLLQSSNVLSGAVPLPVAYEVTVQNDSVDVRLSEESSDSAPGSPAFHAAGRLSYDDNDSDVVFVT